MELYIHSVKRRLKPGEKSDLNKNLLKKRCQPIEMLEDQSKEDLALQQTSEWLDEGRRLKRRICNEDLQKKFTEFSASNFVIL
jgi:hypothetical protein